MNTIYTIREIENKDNEAIAKIIRQGLMDFDAVKPGTVYYDDTTDNLYEVFRKEKSTYFILLIDGEIVGGGGVYPTEGLEENTCELVKLYLKANFRGKGYGKILMNHCVEKAMALKYQYMYLESMPELNIAIPLYEKYGFGYLKAPMGNSKHTSCDIWMLKKL